MSKIKDQITRENDLKMEQYHSFMEWVCDQQQEVSKNEDTKEVEESSNEPSTTGTLIVSVNTLKAVNNINYNPKLGA